MTSKICTVLFSICLTLSVPAFCLADGATYYIDSKSGSDTNSGLSEALPLKTLAKVQQLKLMPGDSLRFKRGSEFAGVLYIHDSGEKDLYITLTDYGDKQSPAPKFTNQTFKEGNFGNCIRLKGSNIRVENLYFHHTPAYIEGNYSSGGGFLTVWEMGAVYIDKGAENCVVRSNEFYDCVVGIKSYGKNALIEYNFVHDCNRVLAKWNWGPIGIWLGGDDQEVRFNRVFNYRAEHPKIRWSGGDGGADGGAFEIDDARYNKTNISIHHNYTRDCQGFLEVTWTDVKSHPVHLNFQIHHNISDDYQQFVALWAGAKCNIANNTIIRRKKNANDWGVFNITQEDSRNKIKNNIIVTEQDITIFNTGLNGDHKPKSIIQNNLYFAASGTLRMGREGPGEGAIFADPLLANYEKANRPEDFSILRGSPAIDKGLDLNYRRDFVRTLIPEGSAADIGAFEFIYKK